MQALPAFTATLALPRSDTVVIARRGGPIIGPGRGSWGTPCLTDQPVCRRGLTCTPDSSPLAGWNAGVCCLPDEVACGGICRGPCPNPLHVYEPVNCSCQCPNTYPDPCGGAPWVLDQATCRCTCDPSLPCPVYGQTRNPANCACECPPGQIACHGLCIDPLTDQTFCGGCPGDTCNPYDQKCCHGVCTTLDKPENCRDCDDAVSAGWDCCHYTPTRLQTNTNCLGCDDACTGGKQCTPSGCRCPPGRIDCSGTCCPATHQGCCNTAPAGAPPVNTCINLNTNKNHCGQCGHRCDVYEICVNGQCVCPLAQGFYVCHGRCCRPGTYCATVYNPNSVVNCCIGPSYMACDDPRTDCCPAGTVCCATGCCPAP